ncbi:MAG: hypothetical protein AAFR87_00045 [Bacteroidota bacterium]
MVRTLEWTVTPFLFASRSLVKKIATREVRLMDQWKTSSDAGNNFSKALSKDGYRHEPLSYFLYEAYLQIPLQEFSGNRRLPELTE